MILYGEKSMIKLRKHTPDPATILVDCTTITAHMYGPEIDIQERVEGQEWAMVGSIGRTGEHPEIPFPHRLVHIEELKSSISVIKHQIRESSLQTQNTDQGFDRYIRHFKPDLDVVAAIWVEKGTFGEYAWSVFFRQRNHRWVLCGCVYTQPEEAAPWEALSAWANFRPTPGQPKSHKAYLFFSKPFAHELAEAWDHFEDLPQYPKFSSVSSFQQQKMC
jgi:hypothetical protein